MEQITLMLYLIVQELTPLLIQAYHHLALFRPVQQMPQVVFDLSYMQQQPITADHYLIKLFHPYPVHVQIQFYK